MKINFNRQMIINAVAPLMNTVSNKSTMTAAEGIHMEALEDGTCTMTTFDLEKGTRLTVTTDVVEPGCFILNAQKFAQTVRVMEGEEVTLEIDDKMQACISSGKSAHRMNALPGSDYPQTPRLETEEGFVISQKVLKEMIGKAMYAMASNDQRPVLNGCYFKVTEGKLLVVSCDSFKLARCSVDVDIENKNTDGAEMNLSFIIPTKSVNELYRLLSDDEEKKVRVCMTRKNIVFHFEDLVFFSRLIDGLYIDYDRIIQRSHKIFAFAKKDKLISALERAALITEEKVAGSVRSHVKLEFEEGLLKISAVSTLGSTYDEIQIDHVGDDLLIAFNNRFLIDSLRACSAETVQISMTSALTSINIEPSVHDEKEGVKELFMLLPVRMKD